MFTYKDKPIKTLLYRAAVDDFAALAKVWADYHHYSRSNLVLSLISPSTVNSKMNNLKTPVQSDATLYFGKTSDFPRYKLQESSFKRCVKLDKADAVVIHGALEYNYRDNVTLLEDEEYIYLIDRNVNYTRASDRKKQSEWDTDWFAYIQKYNLFYGTEIKKIHSGDVYFYSQDVFFDLDNIMNGNYKVIIEDKTLDSLVNKNLDTLTADDITSICDMLDSPDKSTKGLGLKLLCAYNVGEVPLTVRTILGTRVFLTSVPEWTSVAVKQMLQTVNWAGFGDFPFNMNNIIKPHWKTYTYTDYDKSLCSNVYMIAARNYMDEAVKRLTNSGILSTFGVNVTYEIK